MGNVNDNLFVAKINKWKRVPIDKYWEHKGTDLCIHPKGQTIKF
jgi:hypothetical protein